MTVSISHRVFDTVEPTRDGRIHSTSHCERPASRTRHVQHVRLEAEGGAGTWLMIHEAPRPLRISLRENGYGLL